MIIDRFQNETTTSKAIHEAVALLHQYETVDLEAQRWVCDVCGMSHGNEVPHVCESCGRTDAFTLQSVPHMEMFNRW